MVFVRFPVFRLLLHQNIGVAQSIAGQLMEQPFQCMLRFLADQLLLFFFVPVAPFGKGEPLYGGKFFTYIAFYLNQNFIKRHPVPNVSSNCHIGIYYVQRCYAKTVVLQSQLRLSHFAGRP